LSTSSVTFGDSFGSQFGIVAQHRYRSLCSVPHWAFSCLHPPQAAAGYGPQGEAFWLASFRTTSFTGPVKAFPFQENPFRDATQQAP